MVKHVQAVSNSAFIMRNKIHTIRNDSSRGTVTVRAALDSTRAKDEYECLHITRGKITKGVGTCTGSEGSVAMGNEAAWLCKWACNGSTAKWMQGPFGDGSVHA